jgi:thiol-disulfide isomerase/thioredoxin
VANLLAVDARNALSPGAGLWLVAFYAQGCGPCQALVPKLLAAADKLHGVARVGALDCATHPQACEVRRRAPASRASKLAPRPSARVR